VTDFPDIPKAHIRRIFLLQRSFYAPTHMLLLQQSLADGGRPYTPKKNPTRTSKAKGKSKAVHDAEFEKEREWLLQKVKSESIAPNDQMTAALKEQQYEELLGNDIECGCCFASHAFVCSVVLPTFFHLLSIG
jgi:E3 ubiquitin-protein ligase RNF216